MEDSRFVLAQVEAIAQAATHGGFQKAMTADPFYLSKAVFEWWWFAKDNRSVLFRPAARAGHLPLKDTTRGPFDFAGLAWPIPPSWVSPIPGRPDLNQSELPELDMEPAPEDLGPLSPQSVWPSRRSERTPTEPSFRGLQQIDWLPS